MWLVATLTSLLIVLLAASSARADGDPASDVLASQPAFVPQDAGVSAHQQAQLNALLAQARRRGYELRVAVVGSPTDLGSVSALWHQPQNYARFLGQELSLLYRGPLLVVMPNGYGVCRSGFPASQLGAPGPRLGDGALGAVQRLAAMAGYHLALPSAVVAAPASSSDPVAWIAFALGCLLIILAWGASLRARPLSTGRGAAAS